MRNIFLIGITIFLISCKQKIETDQYNHIPFLHQVRETKNYEVLEIKNGSSALWDSIDNQYLISGATFYKFSTSGILKDSIIKSKLFYIGDKYTFSEEEYTTWLYDGKKDNKEFVNLTPERKLNDKDTSFYKQKFVEFYNKSKIVRYGSQDMNYFFYYENNWYYLWSWGKSKELKLLYPEKLPPPRLKSIELNPNPPDYVKQFYVPRKKVNSISDAVGAPKDFTLGTYIIRVGLPGGDSLVYRRFGDGLGNLSTFYQKPSSEGGNDSIIFIKQDYHNNKMIDGGTYFSHGGLFMIRPKRK